MPLSFIPLGVGDAFTARYFSSALAVEADGAWLLVDCPHPIRRMLRDAGEAAGVRLDVGHVAGVVLTHLHADHVSGLEGLAFFSHFVLGRRPTLLAHPAVSARLWDGHLAVGMGRLLPAGGGPLVDRRLEDYLELVPLDEERAVRLGPFEVECRRTIHHVPTTALRVRAGGRTLGYSADTSFDPSLIEWLGAADLVIHETNHGIHTPLASLASLPAELRARLRLIHYPDELDVDACPIEALRQGRRYVV